jgi:hypothetical protein
MSSYNYYVPVVTVQTEAEQKAKKLFNTHPQFKKVLTDIEHMYANKVDNIITKHGFDYNQVNYGADGCYVVSFTDDSSDEMIAYTLQPVVYKKVDSIIRTRYSPSPIAGEEESQPQTKNGEMIQ